MTPTTRTLRLGVNRGKPRLWLEGQWLADAGFLAKTTHYTATIDANAITIAASADGDRRVSGKGERPIIDIAGDQLAAFAGKELLARITPGRIVIRVTGGAL